MSVLADLENAAVSLIAGISQGGQPMFRSVTGFSDPDRKRGVVFLSHLRPPAALVIYTGRLRSSVESVAGSAKLTVLIEAENLRGGFDPRIGDGTARGGFELLEAVSNALDGAIVVADHRLTLIDEQVADADETHVIYEQRYVIERSPELTPPTFDGVVLTGDSSIVRLIVGEAKADTVAFAFPGIDGEYRHHLGTRSRAIRWEGVLRATGDLQLNDIERVIEQTVADGGALEIADAWGRVYPDCVCDRFVRSGPRLRHPVSGYAMQAFELHFLQLNV